MKVTLPNWLDRLLSYKYSLLILSWLVLTLFNINKAYHIDDTFHLEAAEWIRNNPTTPMAGKINWFNMPTPLSEHNQPPLYFYFIALVSSIVGTSELALHLFQSIFTFLSLLYFIKILNVLSINNKNYLLALLAFSPSLLVNQNLMVDVPILSITMGGIFYLLKAKHLNKTINYLLAFLFLGLGLLIKYSLLPLFIVFTYSVIIRRDYRQLYLSFIPIIFLGLWSFWNFKAYGRIHLLDRESGFHIMRLWWFMLCLGSMAIFSFPLIDGYYQKRFIRKAAYSIGLMLIILIILVLLNLFPEKLFSKILVYLFLINGFLVFFVLWFKLIKELRAYGLLKVMESDRFIIFLSFISLSLFMILFAPFGATRHILLVLPFILIFGKELLDKTTKRMNSTAIGITVVLALLLGISDWKYADFYRQQAANIEIPYNENVYYAGHWGWQWYSEKRGWKQFHLAKSDITIGDYLIFPGDISIEKIDRSLKVDTIRKIWQDADITTYFSVSSFASMYSSSLERPPWNISMQPLDTIYICKVKEIVNKERP